MNAPRHRFPRRKVVHGRIMPAGRPDGQSSLEQSAQIVLIKFDSAQNPGERAGPACRPDLARCSDHGDEVPE
jgi:hypothetical protein